MPAINKIKQRNKSISLDSEPDLERRRKSDQYNIERSLHQALKNVSIIAIYVVPLFFLMLFSLFMFNELKNDRWITLQKILFIAGGFIVGYLTKFLKDYGIERVK